MNIVHDLKAVRNERRSRGSDTSVVLGSVISTVVFPFGEERAARACTVGREKGRERRELDVFACREREGDAREKQGDKARNNLKMYIGIERLIIKVLLYI